MVSKWYLGFSNSDSLTSSIKEKFSPGFNLILKNSKLKFSIKILKKIFSKHAEMTNEFGKCFETNQNKIVNLLF